MSVSPVADHKPRSRWANAAIWGGGFVALLWAVEIVDAIMGQRLDDNGVRPWTVDGLAGILFAPLLQSDWAHLISNTVPAFMLTATIVLTSGAKVWVEATGVIWVVAGVGTWLIGGLHTNHVGASSLIFGWVTFLVLRGIFTRRLSDILVGIVIAGAYGYVIWGVFPSTPGISWQGHLCGAVGGALAAVIFGRRVREAKAASDNAVNPL